MHKMVRRLPILEMVYDTFTGTATRAAHCGSMLKGLRLSHDQARLAQGDLRGSGRRSVIPYVHERCCIIACVVLFKAELNLSASVACLILL
jgi:hypothetical protein